jgi:thioesterase domain-containing protein
VAHLGLLRAGGIGYARSVIGGRLETLRHKLERVRLSVARRFRTNTPAPKSMDAFVAANAVSIQRYKPQPYAGRMLIIRADANVFDSPRAVETGLGWQEVAQAGFDVVDVPGDHLSILEEPGIQEVAAAFAKALGAPG